MEYNTQYSNQPPPPAYSAAPASNTAAINNTTVVVGQPSSTAIVGVPMLTDAPMPCTCPLCHQNIVTNVEFVAGPATWLFCFFLWFIGLGLGCCLIPFCVDACKDAVHTCPNCNNHIGTHSRL